MSDWLALEEEKVLTATIDQGAWKTALISIIIASNTHTHTHTGARVRERDYGDARAHTVSVCGCVCVCAKVGPRSLAATRRYVWPRDRSGGYATVSGGVTLLAYSSASLHLSVTSSVPSGSLPLMSILPWLSSLCCHKLLLLLLLLSLFLLLPLLLPLNLMQTNCSKLRQTKFN